MAVSVIQLDGYKLVGTETGPFDPRPFPMPVEAVYGDSAFSNECGLCFRAGGAGGLQYKIDPGRVLKVQRPCGLERSIGIGVYPPGFVTHPGLHRAAGVFHMQHHRLEWRKALT